MFSAKSAGKKDILHKLLKITYVSACKHANSLKSESLESAISKAANIAQYLKKKEAESREIEIAIEKDLKKEEEEKECEVLIEISKYLGEKGLTKTAESLVKEMHLEEFIYIDIYSKAKNAIKIVSSNAEYVSAKHESDAESAKAFIRWQFASLCKESKKDALRFCQKHYNTILSSDLSLLPLNSNSALFRKISAEHSERNAFLRFLSKGYRSALYPRVSLGISGFTTSACKEKEGSLCPGCSAETAKIARNLPRSMRSTTRVLCSQTGKLIPEGAPIVASPTGDVYPLSSIVSEGRSFSSSEYKMFRRCYFV